MINSSNNSSANSSGNARALDLARYRPDASTKVYVLSSIGLKAQAIFSSSGSGSYRAELSVTGGLLRRALPFSEIAGEAELLEQADGPCRRLTWGHSNQISTVEWSDFNLPAIIELPWLIEHAAAEFVGQQRLLGPISFRCHDARRERECLLRFSTIERCELLIGSAKVEISISSNKIVEFSFSAPIVGRQHFKAQG